MFDPDIYIRFYEQRKREEAAAKRKLVKPIPKADTAEVMREQLEDLLEHVAGGLCGCSLCHRYLEAEGPLMRPFDKAMKLGA